MTIRFRCSATAVRLAASVFLAAPMPPARAAEAPMSLEQLNVGLVMQSIATLQHVDALPASDAVAWRGAHTVEMERAYLVLNMAALVRETVLHVHSAAVAQYGVQLVCNYDDERKPRFDELVELFVTDGMQRFGIADRAAARAKLYLVNWDEMLAQTMLRHFPCRATASATP